jgi:hypothetical protein
MGSASDFCEVVVGDFLGKSVAFLVQFHPGQTPNIFRGMSDLIPPHTSPKRFSRLPVSLRSDDVPNVHVSNKKIAECVIRDNLRRITALCRMMCER